MKYVFVRLALFDAIAHHKLLLSFRVIKTTIFQQGKLFQVT